MGLVRLEPPSGSIVELAEAKLHLRMDGDAEDQTVERSLAAATGSAERWTGRVFLTQRWALTLDSFPVGGSPIRLPLPPLQSVEVIKYFDSSDTEQTLPSASYAVEQTPLHGQVYPAWPQSWPATSGRRSSVRVEFTAGYGNGSAVPPEIVSAVLLLLGSFDQNREAVVIGTIVNELPLGVEHLLAPFVIPSTP